MTTIGDLIFTDSVLRDSVNELFFEFMRSIYRGNRPLKNTSLLFIRGGIIYGKV